MILYHGSSIIVEKPKYGYGKTTNDYGQGFYCTEDPELAREWACFDKKGGFINTYSLDTGELSMLELDEANVIEWIAILVKHRFIRFSSPVERRMSEYIISHFMPESLDYDIIKGYRADDSYFSYVRAFLSNTISLQQLSQAMKLGNLGMQIFLQSEKAFERIRFVEADEVPGDEYYSKRMKRDYKAREDYYRLLEESVSEGIFARDIVGKEMTADELRI